MHSLSTENPNEEKPDPKVLVIHASLAALPQFSRAEAGHIETLQFEFGSQIRRLDARAFGHFSSLTSICIPASVEFIADDGFAVPHGPSPLTKVTFEPGSKLREIEPGAFFACSALREFCIPASVEKLTGLSLPPSALCLFDVEMGNAYFHRRGAFLMSSNDPYIVRYVGRESEVRIADEIDRIDEGCFRFCDISVVTFGANSQLSSIGEQAFRGCQQIKMITIPSSVTVLGNCCFESCAGLETVAFGAGSKLDAIPAGSFAACNRLRSITVPASVKIIADDCFSECSELRCSPIPADSGLIRLGRGAFESCEKLAPMSLPSTLEVVEGDCFLACDSLATFTFAAPSHLRELLSLPPGLRGSLAIPDSVEMLGFDGEFDHRPSPLLTFGRESRLSNVQVSNPSAGRRTFFQVSSRNLKVLRENWEFDSEK
jgi:hypothetical protein